MMKKSTKNKWFSVRCVFKHDRRKDMSKRHLYEERITVWHTTSFEKAIQLAEREAQTYEQEADCEYVGLAQAFNLFASRLVTGAEVFSLMRESNLSASKYLDKHFDTGTERQRDVKK